MNLNAVNLVSILSAASSLLRNAYKLCSGTLKRVKCGHSVSGDVGYYFCDAFVSRGWSCCAGYMMSLLSSRRLDRKANLIVA